ncbi:18450_t:CDS:2 [Rhizophagus irregularis]|nr:18450_t:CDS:2 [Rhizophagus irregularis]
MLTEQRLQSDSYNFPGGVILFIEELIKKFKSQVGDELLSCNVANVPDKIVPMLGYRNLYGKNEYNGNSAHSKLNDIELLRRLFRGIAEDNNFTFKAIADELKSTNHSISETTVEKFYRNKSDLTLDNKLAVQKWIGKFIDEWKKDDQSVTILVKLDPAHSTK